MNNINYSIIVNNSSNQNEILDIEHLINEINAKEIIEKEIIEKENNATESIKQMFECNNSDAEADFITYYTYYNVKDLYKILEYYSLPKSKLKKDELIQMIVLYENDFNNYEIVQRRKLLWHYIEELKNDDYMKKYILF